MGGLWQSLSVSGDRGRGPPRALCRRRALPLVGAGGVALPERNRARERGREGHRVCGLTWKGWVAFVKGIVMGREI